MNRRLTPLERRDAAAPRGRPLARHAGGRRIVVGWLWLVLAVARRRWAAPSTTTRRAGSRPAPTPVADSAAAARTRRRSPRQRGPLRAPPIGRSRLRRRPARRPPTAALRAERHGPCARRRRSRPAATAADRRPGDSGGIRLVGLPRGSTVMIDERPVARSGHAGCPPGPHALAVSAPRFNFFTDTIVVRAGRYPRADARSSLPLGAPDAAARRRPETPAQPVAAATPGRDYNADGSCFDERPKPVDAAVRAGARRGRRRRPRPSLLWVKVSAEGRTVDVKRLRPSDDPGFERAVARLRLDRHLAPGAQGRHAGRGLDPDALPAAAAVKPAASRHPSHPPSSRRPPP